MCSKTTFTIFVVLNLFFSTGLFADQCSFVSREEWGAKPAKHSVANTVIPRAEVYLYYNQSPKCDTQESCSEIARSIQETDASYPDIRFNFWVGGDGRVYEGAGWKNNGRHGTGVPASSSLIVAYGGPEEKAPETLQVIRNFLDCGVELGELDEKYKLLNPGDLHAHR